MNLKNYVYRLTATTIVCLMPILAWGESLQKHPRVAELEDSISENATLYLKSRFPERPFLVNVSVDPLRRVSGKSTSNSEDLPYFDGASDEIQDEWDDPQVSLKSLLLRVQKVSLTVSLSTTLSDSEVAEVKESMMKALHLLPARDEIQFSFRSWATSNEKWIYPTLAFGIALLFLCGFFLIQRSGVSRLTTALKEQKSMGSGGAGSSSIAPLSPSHGTSSTSRGESNSTTVRGGVQVSDPIRARELVARFVETLEKSPTFPTLNSVVLLEEYGDKNPSGLGAILAELPAPIQKRLYALGASDCWFKALNTPAMITLEEIEAFQRLVREPESGRTRELEEMIIKVWRLGVLIPEFIRSYPRDVAMTILSYLPKGMAITSARKAFPGAWADLLDPQIRLVEISAAKANEIAKNAEDIRPLGKLEDFKRQQSESELFEYLRIASPEEEREIYLASRSDSIIHRSRPPFYSLFEEPETLLKEFCPQITPDQWALALFNVERTARRKIQAFLGEKQSFLLMETIKQLDQVNPDKFSVGAIRESIALSFRHFRTSKQGEIDAMMASAIAVERSGEETSDYAEAA